MKKALLIIVAILAVSFLIGNAALMSEFANTVVHGELLPLSIAVVVTVLRYITQGASYNAAFETVKLKTGVMQNVYLVLGLVFINTFCLFSGATGVAFIIDDARRKSGDIGIATSGAVLTQIGYFAALLIVSIVGMLLLFFYGTMNTLFLIGSLLLIGTLGILCSFFVLAHFKPGALHALFRWVESVARRVLKTFNRNLAPGWGSGVAESFVTSSKLLISNPSGVVVTIAYATLSATFNCACLVAVGFAFGYDQVIPLIAAFSLAAVSIQLSPTPQGIGITEAVITAMLTAYGCTIATSAAIALVYRGIMLWLPFIAGALCLSQTDFFKDKKEPTIEDKNKDVAWVSATIMGILGLVNIGLTAFSDLLLPYRMLTQFVEFSDWPIPVASFDFMHIMEGVILLVLAAMLAMRWRTGWIISVTMLILLGGMEIYLGIYQVGIPILAFAAWLIWKRDVFSRQTPWTSPLLKTQEEGIVAQYPASETVSALAAGANTQDLTALIAKEKAEEESIEKLDLDLDYNLESMQELFDEESDA